MVVFGADHGVTAEGVSAYPSEVTQAMVAAMEQGVATVTALATQVGATFSFHDAGGGRPTGNIRAEDAMSPDEFDDAVKVGVDASTIIRISPPCIPVLGDVQWWATDSEPIA